MFKKTIISIVIILISSFPAFSTEGQDGNWWRTLQREQKYYYLVGILNGLDLAVTFLTMDEKHDRQIVTEVVVLYHLNQQNYFKNVTYEQLIDGLDDFFSDYKNRCIELNSGIFIVLKRIRGDSEDEINTMIKNLRRFPLEKEKVLRELQEKNK